MCSYVRHFPLFIYFQALFTESLKNFSAYKNCFSSAIPENICNAVNLEYAILSGLTLGAACTVRKWPFLSNSAYISSQVKGQVIIILFFF